MYHDPAAESSKIFDSLKQIGQVLRPL